MEIADLQIIIPTYRDDLRLRRLLEQLQGLRVIVVDGDQNSDTETLVSDFGAQYVAAEPSRGGQICRGVEYADASWLWVLHADSCLGADCRHAIRDVIAKGDMVWGRFNIRLPGVPVVARMMNLRSRITQICTGDQGVFFHRELLDRIGGFPAQPLMEDIELCKRLKQKAGNKFVPLAVEIESSARRWQQKGVLRTIVNMWWFRLRYFFGAKPEKLYEHYYR